MFQQKTLKEKLRLGESNANILPVFIVKKVPDNYIENGFLDNFITIGYKWKDKNNVLYGSYFYLPKDKISILIEGLNNFNIDD